MPPGSHCWIHPGSRLVPSHAVKTLQLIWRTGTRRFHLRVPDLQMSCTLTWLEDRTTACIAVPTMAVRVICAIVRSKYTSAVLSLVSWWRHQMETFSALLALCVGNSPVTGEFPTQRSVTRSFDVLFDLRLNNRSSKHSWGWWFETPSRSLWHHCNVILMLHAISCYDRPRCNETQLYVAHDHWRISTRVSTGVSELMCCQPTQPHCIDIEIIVI